MKLTIKERRVTINTFKAAINDAPITACWMAYSNNVLSIYFAAGSYHAHCYSAKDVRRYGDLPYLLISTPSPEKRLVTLF